MLGPRGIATILRRAAAQWSRDNTSFYAAGLAYYTMLALAPLLIVFVGIASATLAPAAAEGRLVSTVGRVMGMDAANLIQDIILATSRSQAGTVASALGLFISVVAASNVFHQMKFALNTIWHVPVGVITLKGIVLGRFRALAILAFMALMILTWLTVDASVAVSGAVLRMSFAEHRPIWYAVTSVISIGFNTLLFGFFYCVVPDAPVSWRDVGLGAITGALLFTLGKALLGIYFDMSGVLRAYGAAGSIVAVLLWLNYSGQVFLFGAEVSAEYARTRGSRAQQPQVRGLAP